MRIIHFNKAEHVSNTARMPKFTHVAFTHTGRKNFCCANRSLGMRFIRAFVLKYELGAYLSAHEIAGIHMDTECQELRYDDGVCVILRKVQGTWYIVDVILTSVPDAFVPVWTIKTVLCGLMGRIVRVLAGWQNCSSKSMRREVMV